jgi:hypothetical protein
VQPRCETPHGQQRGGGDAQHHHGQRHAEERFAGDGARTEKHIARTLAMGVGQRQHQRDQQHRVTE